MKSKVTLKSIAQALNVTHTTVSNAYNRPEKLSLELKERILTYAKSVGYDGPNAAARFLQTGKSGTIGVIFNQEMSYAFSDPHATRLFRGISEVCQEHGLNLLLLPLSSNEQILNVMVDGYIFNATFKNDPIIEKIINKAPPVVTIDLDLPGFGSVSINNKQAAYEIAQYVFSKGHKEVAVLTFPFSRNPKGLVKLFDHIQGDNQVSLDRLCGVRDAHVDAGLDPNKSVVYEVPDNMTGNEAAKKILEEHPNTTALICFSDKLAVEALRYCKSRGIKIPEEISITGFDNIPMSGDKDICLTTVNQSAVQIGRLATLNLINGKRDKITVEHDLVIRATS
ncbi:LacI family transcriptional regulator [Photobacterium gaetbulicola]|uniref:Putative LacI family transcription regulator n=1 Tax=Photobacterium gaetbulicola Gung47 TaxID=658445 RepID=A0A0C5WCP7_9GAMM|nr:LacI family DNA-binding transcriptional regulator [Photobacterium gaetbulicola]AJR09476.1 putative LacI family transcription regulator [Photobacterium gaetbulicola Gung47]PSU14271.1 LacI family transcriptional regulator [Photobacterium gaetbulicola]